MARQPRRVPAPPAPPAGIPGPSAPPARRGLTPPGQVPAQMFLGCASGRGNDRAREASARLGLRGKHGKKEKCSVPGPCARSALPQPWWGPVTPCVCWGQPAGQWGDSGCAPWGSWHLSLGGNQAGTSCPCSVMALERQSVSCPESEATPRESVSVEKKPPALTLSNEPSA